MVTKQQIDTAKHPQGQEGHDTLLRMNSSHNDLTHWALDQLTIDTADQILDVGCGGGATILRLLQKFPDSFVHGIDYAEESILCSKSTTVDVKNCQVSQGDVHALVFPDHSFDLVTAFETVYFWQDIPRAFSEIKRVLKPHGKFLLCCEMSDPQNPRWQNILSEMTISPACNWCTRLETARFAVEVSQTRDEWICVIADSL